MDGKDKLHILRTLMKERGYDAYIIPHGDCHDNEYIAESDERIKFISNFSGSNGLGLVTQDVALMWTDGRYFIQIEKELYPGWQMKKMREEESLPEYVLKNLDEESTIGMDYSLFTQESAMRIKNRLGRYNIVDDKNNIIDDIWGTLKPKYKNNKLLILSEKFTGIKVLEKYQTIDRMLAKEKADNYRLLISRLDDIAWLLNLRGSDIPYNPVFFSYALFCKNKDQFCTKLFVNKEKLDSPEMKKYCEDNQIILFNYEDIIPELEKSEENLVTFYDEDSTNHRMFQTLKEIKVGYISKLSSDIIEFVKSVKNPVEIEGYKKANIKDSVALVKFFAWMEDELVNKNRTDLNEYQIGLKNKEMREDQENYMGEYIMNKMRIYIVI